MQIKLVEDLIKSISLMLDSDPENILNLLIRAGEIVGLKLVTDQEFMSLLVSRTSGRLVQIIGGHIGTTHNWGVVQDEIISTFLPPQLKEKFLRLRVLDRFQTASEDLATYVSSVVAAAITLGFEGSELQLVSRLLQNMHPRLKSYLLFVTKPESVKDLYSLATTVAEAVAVEDQRKQLTAPAQQGVGLNTVTKNLAIQGFSSGIANPGVRC
jgi:hypothetical protein